MADSHRFVPMRGQSAFPRCRVCWRREARHDNCPGVGWPCSNPPGVDGGLCNICAPQKATA